MLLCCCGLLFKGSCWSFGALWEKLPQNEVVYLSYNEMFYYRSVLAQVYSCLHIQWDIFILNTDIVRSNLNKAYPHIHLYREFKYFVIRYCVGKYNAFRICSLCVPTIKATSHKVSCFCTSRGHKLLCTVTNMHKWPIMWGVFVNNLALSKEGSSEWRRRVPYIHPKNN